MLNLRFDLPLDVKTEREGEETKEPKDERKEKKK